MTGHELVSRFYYADLTYLKSHPEDNLENISLMLFLVGLIETACIISSPTSMHPDVVEFLNAN